MLKKLRTGFVYLSVTWTTLSLLVLLSAVIMRMATYRIAFEDYELVKAGKEPRHAWHESGGIGGAGKSAPDGVWHEFDTYHGWGYAMTTFRLLEPDNERGVRDKYIVGFNFRPGFPVALLCPWELDDYPQLIRYEAVEK